MCVCVCMERERLTLTIALASFPGSVKASVLGLASSMDVPSCDLLLEPLVIEFSIPISTYKYRYQNIDKLEFKKEINTIIYLQLSTLF